jgi:hypothetical protein
MFFLFYLCGAIAAENNKASVDSTVNNYRVYSLARCITNNYKEMGVDFNKLSLKDNTMGFIDMDNGLGFSAERNNELDEFIKNKTENFYQPKQKNGDLASINLVVYDCMGFYHSKELTAFLNKLIRKSTIHL